MRGDPNKSSCCDADWAELGHFLPTGNAGPAARISLRAYPLSRYLLRPSQLKDETIMNDGSNQTKRPNTDWSRFDAMSGAERHQAALDDPDAQPLTEADLAR